MILPESLSRKMRVVFLLAAVAGGDAVCAAEKPFAPDSLLFKDGKEAKGLIIQNKAKEIVFQDEKGETVYQKSDIVRIRDEDDNSEYFSSVHRAGKLPPWRLIANDLRTNDSIRSLVQAPAVRIENGPFKNIPYLSFRVNQAMEMNIFGDPADPVGIEFGLYGGRKFDSRVRESLRGRMAGLLSTRQEIAAFYSIDPSRGGEAQAGNLRMQILPPGAPEAYGTWWVLLYRAKDLDAHRIPDAQYFAATVERGEVKERRGRLPEKALGGMIAMQAKQAVQTGAELGREVGDGIEMGAGVLAKTGSSIGQGIVDSSRTVSGVGEKAASDFSRGIGWGAVSFFKAGTQIAQGIGKGTQSVLVGGGRMSQKIAKGTQGYFSGFFRDSRGRLQLMVPALPEESEKKPQPSPTPAAKKKSAARNAL